MMMQKFILFQIYDQMEGTKCSAHLPEREKWRQAASTRRGVLWHNSRWWLPGLVHNVTAIGHHGEDGF